MQNKGNNLNILVTGGAGFIGSHLVDELIIKNYRVRVLDNLRNGSLENLRSLAKNPNFSFIKGDILNPEDVSKAIFDVEVVYHLACLGVRHSLHSPYENHKVNAEGTLRVLAAAKQHKIKKFFYISSSEIYGGVKRFPINETSAPHPYTVYGASKLAGENYAYAYYKCYGLDTTILRIFNNYGPRAHFEGDAGELIPRTIVSVIYNKSPVVFGDGNVTRDFFYVKDTARALASLINFNNLRGAIINIGTGREIKIKEVVKKILALMKKDALKIRYLEPRRADVPRLWVDVKKFYKLIKFKSKYTFKDGLRETIEYYSELSKKKNLLSQIIEKNWENEKYEDSRGKTLSYRRGSGSGL